MKSLLVFWRVVLEELGQRCRISTGRDLKTVTTRFENEGDEFLTITLPRLAKGLERALADGVASRSLWPGFRTRGELPSLLGGFFEIIFERDTGRLRDVACDEGVELLEVVEAVWSIRQLSLMFGKIEKPCTPAREQKAFDDYIACEQELKLFEDALSGDDLSSFRHISNMLFADVLTDVDQSIYYHRLIPKHGPGATADRLTGNRKFDQVEWTERLESVFPYGEYAIPNWRYYYLLDRVQLLEPEAERPVRVISVPKTQEKPRIIAIEPTCMQYMQQAISRRLVRGLESSPTLKGMIGFRDQLPNQELALEGSLWGKLATLDLSEASDRVSWLLVKDGLLSRWKSSTLVDAISACRSLRADVPGHGVVPLTKFASMGSALTFPLEAMVFLTCVFHGICSALNKPMSRSLIREWRDSVRIYGDDIIVPVEFATHVKESLELFGFKVNANKSFWTGWFRESCGAEFYLGHDVSIVRVRQEFPQSRADVPEVLSAVSLRNQLYEAGLWRSTAYLDSMMCEILPHYPLVTNESPLVGRHSVLGYEVQGIRANTHSPVVRGYRVSTRIPKSSTSGEGALLKWFLNKEEFEDHSIPLAWLTDDDFFALEEGKEVIVDLPGRDHLERQGRPEAVRLKLRWGQPF